MPPAEDSLIEVAQRGDRAALASLYEGYFDRVFRYVSLRVFPQAEAEDLTSDVFTKMLESIGGYRSRGVPFSAWLFRIAHNLIIDHARRSGRRQQTSLDDELPLPAREDPAGEVELRLDIADLCVVLRQVTDAQRDVLALRFGAGLPISDTASVMGRSEGAVKALQHSALAALRRNLARMGSALGQPVTT